MKLKSLNPAKNYEVIGEVEVSTSRDIEIAVQKAHKAAFFWAETPIEKRAEFIRKLKELILKDKENIARLITEEVGKPIRESRDDIDFDQKYLEYFINAGPEILAEKIVFEDEKSRGKIVFEPYGVAAVISPWNFPIGMPLWGIAPNLIAGNTVVFKPSEETPLVGQKLADLIAKTGLPKGVFNIIHGNGKVGAKLLDSDIDLVWFTGSTKVGQKIYEKAGKKFIKAILELGGSSPAIVFQDADIESTVEEIFMARFLNCGQVCTAIKRLFVAEPIFEEFVAKLKTRVEKVKIGDPMDETSEMGSLVSKKQLNLLEDQIFDAKKKGAKIITGGKRPANLKGAYYLPTFLTNIKKNMRVYTEEVFGPVLPVMSFKNINEAIELANDTIYGLSAEIYTKDKKLAENIARKIKAGTVAINTDSYFKPECPFGGYKKSGMGREMGEYGMQEFTQMKHIHFKK